MEISFTLMLAERGPGLTVTPYEESERAPPGWVGGWVGEWACEF
jgi:hypothetical protein